MKTVLLVTLAIVFAFIGASLAQLKATPQQSTLQKSTTQNSTESAEGKQAAPQTEADKAVARTIREVKMLDDIYKGGIVLITKNYVNGEEDLPAGTAFKKLFEAAKKKGWHIVRLVDATGDPYNDENVAVSDFEKRAIKDLKLANRSLKKPSQRKTNAIFLRPLPSRL